MPYKDKERKKEHDKQYYFSHKEQIMQYSRQWNKQWRIRHKAQGLCLNCNQPRSENNVLCLLHLSRQQQAGRKGRRKPEHRELQKIYRRNRYYQSKSENKCSDCGMPLDEESRMGTRCLNCYTVAYKVGY